MIGHFSDDEVGVGSVLKNPQNQLRAEKLLLATALIATLSTAAFAQQRARGQDSERKSDAAASIQLPSDFVGCWKGTIQGDDFTPATPGNTISKDPTTYQLCYREDADGNYRLDLLKLVIGATVTRPERFDSQVLSADYRTGTAEIRSHLVLIQTRYVLWAVPIHFHVDVAAVEDCRLRNRAVIFMRGTQLIAVDGKKYGEQTFHADFRRVSLSSVRER
jgi:hypothetical protein